MLENLTYLICYSHVKHRTPLFGRWTLGSNSSRRPNKFSFVNYICTKLVTLFRTAWMMLITKTRTTKIPEKWKHSNKSVIWYKVIMGLWMTNFLKWLLACIDYTETRIYIRLSPKKKNQQVEVMNNKKIENTKKIKNCKSPKYILMQKKSTIWSHEQKSHKQKKSKIASHQRYQQDEDRNASYFFFCTFTLIK